MENATISMEITKGVHTIDGIVQEVPFIGMRANVNPSIIVGTGGDSLLLIDAGPVSPEGNLGAVEAYVKKMGFDISDIKSIIVTHYHWDHTGNLAELKQRTNAKVYAHKREIPYIQQEVPYPPRVQDFEKKMKAQSPEATDEQIRLFSEWNQNFRPRKTMVDNVLNGNEIMSEYGIQIIETPGHTPGHISIYIPSKSIFVAGDLFAWWGKGDVQGPPPPFTPDMKQAEESMRRSSELNFDCLIGYHGVPLLANASESIRKSLTKSVSMTV